ncbi:hypothetical protein BC831DRAFT_508860 [Entophlyctis helioformis]|nr:hypothetical protein BC831DRAFT_508860 [Entophlyctis helioformis]
MLLAILSSKRTTVLVSGALGALQLIVIGFTVGILLRWQSNRLDSCFYSRPFAPASASASTPASAQSQATCNANTASTMSFEHCSALAVAPTLLLVPLVMAFMLWPLYVFAISLDMACTASYTSWPHRPPYFDQLASIQRTLITRILQREYRIQRASASQALARVVRSPLTPADQTLRLPLEIREMILQYCWSEHVDKMQTVLARLEYTGHEDAMADVDTMRSWLRTLAVIMGFDTDPLGIGSHFIVTLDVAGRDGVDGNHVAGNGGGNGGNSNENEAVDGHTGDQHQPLASQLVWAAVFSRDLALLVFTYMFRMSCIMVLARRRSEILASAAAATSAAAAAVIHLGAGSDGGNGTAMTAAIMDGIGLDAHTAAAGIASTLNATLSLSLQSAGYAACVACGSVVGVMARIGGGISNNNININNNGIIASMVMDGSASPSAHINGTTWM